MRIRHYSETFLWRRRFPLQRGVVLVFLTFNLSTVALKNSAGSNFTDFKNPRKKRIYSIGIKKIIWWIALVKININMICKLNKLFQIQRIMSTVSYVFEKIIGHKSHCHVAYKYKYPTSVRSHVASCRSSVLFLNRHVTRRGVCFQVSYWYIASHWKTRNLETLGQCEWGSFCRVKWHA